jgi:site-specific recombinase XerD
MRNGELISLDVGDVDLAEMSAVIRTEKARSRRQFRSVYWTEPTNESLVEWIEKRDKLVERLTEMVDEKALFISIGNRHGKRFSIKGVGEMLRKYSNKAGLEEVVNAHSLRHGKAHTIVDRGGTSADVTNILGHSSLDSSYVYTLTSGNELKQRARKFLG